MFGRRIDVAERGIDHDDPFAAGRFHIDIVDADPGAGDYLEPGGMVQQRLIDLGAAAGNDGVVGSDRLMQLGNGQAELNVDFDTGIIEKGLEPFLGNFIGKPEWLFNIMPAAAGGMAVLAVGMFALLFLSNKKIRDPR